MTRDEVILGRLPRDGKGNIIGVGDVVWVVAQSFKVERGIVDVAVFPITVIAVDDSDGLIAQGEIRVVARECFLDMREAYREARRVMLAKDGQRERLRRMMLDVYYDGPKPKGSFDTTA